MRISRLTIRIPIDFIVITSDECVGGGFVGPFPYQPNQAHFLVQVLFTRLSFVYSFGMANSFSVFKKNYEKSPPRFFGAMGFDFVKRKAMYLSTMDLSTRYHDHYLTRCYRHRHGSG